jgi:hypothetical protein
VPPGRAGATRLPGASRRKRRPTIAPGKADTVFTTRR